MAFKNQSRRRFLQAMGLGALATAVQSASVSAETGNASKPNVLLILVDDLGYGDLSCYGAKDLKTPNIDALMDAGMRFDNFYANCPVCSPTRAALLTGRYPDLVGVPGVIRTHSSNSWGRLAPDAVLLPAVLKRAGYHCGIVGKWHLGLEPADAPNARGFDSFKGFLGDMMDDYYTHRRFENNYMRDNDREIDPEGHATDLFTDWASEFLRGRAATGTPFFLYLAYNAPHTPIQPPADWLEKVTSREQGIGEDRARLAALIEHLDDGIGKVLATLRDSGLAGDTLVLFTSDNGGQTNVGANNGPLNGGKQQMFEGGIRVPMCAVWPGRIRPGTRSDRVALTMDLFPTICEACGAAFKHTIDGRGILPALLGKAQPPEDRTLIWVRREGGHYGGQDYYAVRRGDWKLLQNSPFDPFQLYNLSEDPGEQHPQANDSPVYKELFTALKDHVIQAGHVPWR